MKWFHAMQLLYYSIELADKSTVNWELKCTTFAICQFYSALLMTIKHYETNKVCYQNNRHLLTMEKIIHGCMSVCFNGINLLLLLGCEVWIVYHRKYYQTEE